MMRTIFDPKCTYEVPTQVAVHPYICMLIVLCSRVVDIE